MKDKLIAEALLFLLRRHDVASSDTDAHAAHVSNMESIISDVATVAGDLKADVAKG